VSNFYMPLQLAPTSLSQPILPNWSFNLFNVNLGITSNAKVEEQALEQVGSYGRQIGRLAEALEVVVKKLDLLENNALSREERDALQVFLGDVAAVRKIKARSLRGRTG
jgi:hypothetical protein